MIKTLLATAAAIEGATGVALVLSPSLCSQLLLASPLDGAAAVVVGRLAGVMLISIAVACWMARRDGASRPARGVTVALLFYNVAVAALLAEAGVRLLLRGALLWPAVTLHAGVAIWCIASLATARPVASR